MQRGSQYVLFFSGGGYTDCNYLTSYATAPSLSGPWTTAFRPLMTTATFDNHSVGLEARTSSATRCSSTGG